MKANKIKRRIYSDLERLSRKTTERVSFSCGDVTTDIVHLQRLYTGERVGRIKFWFLKLFGRIIED